MVSVVLDRSQISIVKSYHLKNGNKKDQLSVLKLLLIRS